MLLRGCDCEMRQGNKRGIEGNRVRDGVFADHKMAVPSGGG